jgi:hypothetical protein
MFKIETVNINARPYLDHDEYQFEAPARAAILHMISCQGEYNYIGSGAFGTVYGSIDSKIVYNFGEYSSNRAYLSFVTELSKLKKHNAFLPMIHGVRIYNAGKGHKKYFVAAMERLNSVGWNSPGFDVAQSIITRMIRDKNSTTNPDSLDCMGINIQRTPDLIEAVKVVQTAHKNANRGRISADYDLHSGNFMLRDRTQLVVIDPLA